MSLLKLFLENTVMSTHKIYACGIGNASQHLADEGAELAYGYFKKRKLNVVACFDAFVNKNNRSLAEHWEAAETKANTVLDNNHTYDNSMIVLTVS